MPERERLVLTLYYYEGLTLAEIGQVLGVTESRVCQIHTKGDPPAPLPLARARTRPRRSDVSGCIPFFPRSVSRALREEE